MTLQGTMWFVMTRIYPSSSLYTPQDVGREEAMSLLTSPSQSLWYPEKGRGAPINSTSFTGWKVETRNHYDPLNY